MSVHYTPNLSEYPDLKCELSKGFSQHKKDTSDATTNVEKVTCSACKLYIIEALRKAGP